DLISKELYGVVKIDKVLIVFFFQAEDGIRDKLVTGVQTCALPILSASGFAGFFGAPLINHILAATGGNWRLAWLVVSGVTILSGILALLFVKERPEDLGQVADGRIIPNRSVSPIAASSLVTTFPWTTRQAYGTPAYWMIVIGGIASQFPFFFFVAHGLLHLKGAGISSGDAAWAMGLLSIAAVGGRLI